MGEIFLLIETSATTIIGHINGTYVVKVNQGKVAALEAVWETNKDGTLGFPIVLIVDEENERNLEALTIPRLGSIFYTDSLDGDVKGLLEVPKEDRPPVAVVAYSFRTMVVIGMILIVVGIYSFIISRGLTFANNNFEEHRRFFKWLPWMLFLPYIAIECGWLVTEMGRQPWSVVGLLRTEHSVSPLDTAQLIFSLGALTLFYTLLGIIDGYFMFKIARRGPIEDDNTIIGGAR